MIGSCAYCERFFFASHSWETLCPACAAKETRRAGERLGAYIARLRERRMIRILRGLK